MTPNGDFSIAVHIVAAQFYELSRLRGGNIVT